MSLQIEVIKTIGNTFVDAKVGDVSYSVDSTNSNVSLLFGTEKNKKSLLGIKSDQITVGASLIPNSNIAYDLGSSDARFRDLYLSGNTINLGDAKITTNDTNNVEFRDQSNNLKKLIVDEIQIGDPTLSNSVTLSKQADGSLTISNTNGSIALSTPTDTNNPLGLTPLSDSVTSTSSLVAATSKAVKVAYDIGAAALPLTGGTLTGTLNGTTINAGEDLKTAGVTRINASGQVSNVSIDCSSINTGTLSVDRLPTATISQAGIVQLSDSTSTSSSVSAATSTAVKAAYNIGVSAQTTANAALPLAGGTLTGTLNGTTLNASTSLQTTGVTRIDASGVLSNVSIDCASITTGTLANARLSNATTIQAGIVQLSDSTSTTSSTLAATSTAVKAAYNIGAAALPLAGGTLTGTLNGTTLNASTSLQTAGVTRINATGVLSNVSIDCASITTGTLANARLSNATTIQAGIVQLSDSTSTTSSTLAATSTAVKAAYDLGAAALPLTGGTLTGTLQATNINLSGSLTLNNLPFNSSIGNLTVDESNSLTLSSSSNVSVLLGNPLTPQLRFGKTDANMGYTNVVTDSSGNVYLSGTHYTSGRLYNADGSASSLYLPTSSLNTCVIKYNSSGVVQWYVSAQGSNGGCAVDSSGNVYLSGTFVSASGCSFNCNGTVSPITLSAPPTAPAGLLAKISSSGTVTWAVRILYAWIYTIAVDGNSNVYVGGKYSTSVAYNLYDATTSSSVEATNANITMPITGQTYGAAYAIQYSSAGIASNAITYDGNNVDQTNNLHVDSSNNVYLVGSYYSSVATTLKKNNSSTATTLRAGSSDAVFVVKFDNSMNVTWASTIDGAYSDQGRNIAVDTLGNVYVSGYYSPSSTAGGKAYFYNASGVASSVTLPLGINTNTAAFVGKFDSSGTPIWCASVDGATNDYGYSVAIDKANNPYLSGKCELSANASVITNSNGQQSTNVVLRTSSGGTSVFVIKFDPSGEAMSTLFIDSGVDDSTSLMAFDSNSNLYLTFSGGNSTNAVTVYDNFGAASSFVYGYGAGVIKFASTFASAAPSYKLLSNLTASNAGRYKMLVNPTILSATLLVQNSADTITLQTFTVPKQSAAYCVWSGTKWYVWI